MKLKLLATINISGGDICYTIGQLKVNIGIAMN